MKRLKLSATGPVCCAAASPAAGCKPTLMRMVFVRHLQHPKHTQLDQYCAKCTVHGTFAVPVSTVLVIKNATAINRLKHNQRGSDYSRGPELDWMLLQESELLATDDDCCINKVYASRCTQLAMGTSYQRMGSKGCSRLVATPQP